MENIMVNKSTADSNLTYHILSQPSPVASTIDIKQIGASRRYFKYFRSEYYPRPSESLKKQIRERDNYTCQLCGASGREIDHIVPLEISHNNSPDNLRVLCHKCNTSRGNRFCKNHSEKINPVNNDAYFKAIERELKTKQIALRLEL